MYKKGQSGNPNGRPRGSVNQKWSDPFYWLGLLARDIKKLTPQEQVETAKAVLEFLAKHAKELGSSKGSRETHEDVAKMLADLEDAKHAGK